ncbi:myrosinase 1-like isoform X2 [Eupeodes corollae]|uniref:myrosinase 1-like isoform X2 n=1 Tax=Eupeodes corollae TaxID=290404 RepID=UPI00248F90E8|nr:myrosinase 1-like isoform X2 [Eupeodes corollae]
MLLFVYLIFCSGLIVLTTEDGCNLPAKGNSKFPSNFSFGVATAAYQIEGGWNADGKGLSLWDDFTHNYPHMIDDKTTGDVAADSYHRFDQDLAALKELKVTHYRFSISWSRIFPNGDISSRNQYGIDYYNNVIDKLEANDIQPIVTMVHFDLPYEIQKIGGFANPLFINQFVTYAIELFNNYGDRVKTWITFNEPLLYCKSGYGEANYPPQIHGAGLIDYICVDNTLKAHAAAYRVYKSKFFNTQGGKIGISLDSQFSISNDTALTHRAMQYNLGFLAHPLFSKSGGYPEVMVEEIRRNSLKEGRITSRLPDLDGKWKHIIKGSADFLAINYYTSRYISRAEKPIGENPSFERDYDLDESIDPKWKRGLSRWLYCVPEGLESILKFIRDEYDNVEVIVTENGWSDKGDLEDIERIQYLKSHLQAVLNAINDGCNVRGYMYWSLIDNFEWQRGYTVKFGLYSVNMTSPTKERTARNSVGYYRKVIETHLLS